MVGDVAGRRVREMLREVARDQEVLYRGRSGGGTRTDAQNGKIDAVGVVSRQRHHFASAAAPAGQHPQRLTHDGDA